MTNNLRAKFTKILMNVRILYYKSKIKLKLSYGNKKFDSNLFRNTICKNLKI